jgi:outer membrane lipoprotein-sorting protein
VDTLYTPVGGLPIRDLILEVECSELVEENGVGNLLPSGTDRLYYKFPNKLRVDTVFYEPGSQLDGKQIVIIRDGANMWMFSSMGQYPMKKGADTQEPSLQLPFSLQKYPQDANNDYTLVGSESFEGIPVKVVQIQNPGRPDLPTKVWIDPVRRVPLQLIQKVKGGQGGPVEKKIVYRDIKQLEDGRYLPMRLEIYEDQVLRKARVYRGAKVNAGLQDSLFEPMKGFMK